MYKPHTKCRYDLKKANQPGKHISRGFISQTFTVTKIHAEDRSEQKQTYDTLEKPSSSIFRFKKSSKDFSNEQEKLKGESDVKVWNYNLQESINDTSKAKLGPKILPNGLSHLKLQKEEKNNYLQSKSNSRLPSATGSHASKCVNQDTIENLHNKLSSLEQMLHTFMDAQSKLLKTNEKRSKSSTNTLVTISQQQSFIDETKTSITSDPQLRKLGTYCDDTQLLEAAKRRPKKRKHLPQISKKGSIGSVDALDVPLAQDPSFVSQKYSSTLPTISTHSYKNSTDTADPKISKKPSVVKSNVTRESPQQSVMKTDTNSSSITNSGMITRSTDQPVNSEKKLLGSASLQRPGRSASTKPNSVGLESKNNVQKRSSVLPMKDQIACAENNSFSSSGLRESSQGGRVKSNTGGINCNNEMCKKNNYCTCYKNGSLPAKDILFAHGVVLEPASHKPSEQTFVTKVDVNSILPRYPKRRSKFDLVTIKEHDSGETLSDSNTTIKNKESSSKIKFCTQLFHFQIEDSETNNTNPKGSKTSKSEILKNVGSSNKQIYNSNPNSVHEVSRSSTICKDLKKKTSSKFEPIKKTQLSSGKIANSQNENGDARSRTSILRSISSKGTCGSEINDLKASKSYLQSKSNSALEARTSMKARSSQNVQDDLTSNVEVENSKRSSRIQKINSETAKDLIDDLSSNVDAENLRRSSRMQKMNSETRGKGSKSGVPSLLQIAKSKTSSNLQIDDAKASVNDLESQLSNSNVDMKSIKSSSSRQKSESKMVDEGSKSTSASFLQMLNPKKSSNFQINSKEMTISQSYENPDSDVTLTIEGKKSSSINSELEETLKPKKSSSRKINVSQIRIKPVTSPSNKQPFKSLSKILSREKSVTLNDQGTSADDIPKKKVQDASNIKNNSSENQTKRIKDVTLEEIPKRKLKNSQLSHARSASQTSRNLMSKMQLEDHPTEGVFEDFLPKSSYSFQSPTEQFRLSKEISQQLTDQVMDKELLESINNSFLKHIEVQSQQEVIPKKHEIFYGSALTFQNAADIISKIIDRFMALEANLSAVIEDKQNEDLNNKQYSKSRSLDITKETLKPKEQTISISKTQESGTHKFTGEIDLENNQYGNLDSKQYFKIRSAELSKEILKQKEENASFHKIQERRFQKLSEEIDSCRLNCSRSIDLPKEILQPKEESIYVSKTQENGIEAVTGEIDLENNQYGNLDSKQYFKSRSAELSKQILKQQEENASFCKIQEGRLQQLSKEIDLCRLSCSRSIDLPNKILEPKQQSVLASKTRGSSIQTDLKQNQHGNLDNKQYSKSRSVDLSKEILKQIEENACFCKYQEGRLQQLSEEIDSCRLSYSRSIDLPKEILEPKQQSVSASKMRGSSIQTDLKQNQHGNLDNKQFSKSRPVVLSKEILKQKEENACFCKIQEGRLQQLSEEINSCKLNCQDQYEDRVVPLIYKLNLLEDTLNSYIQKKTEERNFNEQKETQTSKVLTRPKSSSVKILNSWDTSRGKSALDQTTSVENNFQSNSGFRAPSNLSHMKSGCDELMSKTLYTKSNEYNYSKICTCPPVIESPMEVIPSVKSVHSSKPFEINSESFGRGAPTQSYAATNPSLHTSKYNSTIGVKVEESSSKEMCCCCCKRKKKKTKESVCSICKARGLYVTEPHFHPSTENYTATSSLHIDPLQASENIAVYSGNGEISGMKLLMEEPPGDSRRTESKIKSIQDIVVVDPVTGIKTTTTNTGCVCGGTGVTNTNTVVFPADLLEKLSSKEAAIDPQILNNIDRIIFELQGQRNDLGQVKDMVGECIRMLKTMNLAKCRTEICYNAAGGDFNRRISKDNIYPLHDSAFTNFKVDSNLKVGGDKKHNFSTWAKKKEQNKFITRLLSKKKPKKDEVFQTSLVQIPTVSVASGGSALSVAIDVETNKTKADEGKMEEKTKDKNKKELEEKKVKEKKLKKKKKNRCFFLRICK